ncbi:MAG: DUF4440 domain-containing protein [Gammaproteobacteria bacterium]|nr:DUF4440 domain-containing protein [Gammaproteobacteria bacterium]
MNRELEQAVRNEVERLHDFFVSWFAGELPETSLDAGFVDHLGPDFVLIPPGGIVLSRDDIAEAIRQSYASNPDFRIAIREVRIRQVLDDYLVVTYEEWQRNALQSSPADNGRLATALFRRGPSLEWLHVHETWLPEAVMTAGPYDF